MKNRFFATFLALWMVLTLLPISAFATSFSDVPEGSYYAEAVEWAVSQGITVGTGNGTFSPNQNCTKAQIITFIWRSQGSPSASISNLYSDINGNEYYATAAIWAYEQGMVETNVFSGSEPCTRSMAVDYIWKNAGRPKGGTASFTDVSVEASYADAVAWAVEKGITSGTSSTTFSPDNICTRAQIVTFLKRYDNANTLDTGTNDTGSDTGTSTPPQETTSIPKNIDTPYMYNATGGQNSVSVSWRTVSDVSGYEVHQGESLSGSFRLVKTINGASSHDATITELDAGTTYYFKVRAYVDVNGERFYSGFSGASWAMTAAEEGFSLEVKNTLPVTIGNTGGRKATFTSVTYGTSTQPTGIRLNLTFSGTIVEPGRYTSAPVGNAILYERDSGAMVGTIHIFAGYATSSGDTFT